MKTHTEHLETLTEIRDLMERSSRFISLSGLAGVVAGMAALVGAGLAFYYFGKTPFDGRIDYSDLSRTSWMKAMPPLQFYLINAGSVLLFSIISSIYLTTRTARKNGQKVWDATTRRLLINLLIPLAAGGIYCLILLRHQLHWMVAPTTLIFYGLGLLNAGKYTLNDIRYLGICEIVLGLMAMMIPGYGLEFWAIGFGVLHILYGTYMYFKYERQ